MVQHMPSLTWHTDGRGILVEGVQPLVTLFDRPALDD